MFMPNPSGKNGTGSKEYPADAVLLAAFQQYGRENSGAGLSCQDQRSRLELDFGLTIGKNKLYKLRNSGAGLSCQDQRSRLELDFGLTIGKNKLYKLRRQVGTDSVRKQKQTQSTVETAQLVIDMKERDVTGGWGVTQTKGCLANEGVLIPWDELRTILHDHFDEEFDNQVVGRKRKEQHRTPLAAFGPWHQEHSDGHEKLAQQGLRMGDGIHLPIYASKNQWSVYLHSLILMPNVRDSTAIIHYYLDLVEDRGYKISIQIVTDMGTEINELHKVHEILRREAASDYKLPDFPFGVKESSTKNTPIESFWRWLRDGEGKSVLQAGSGAGIFLPNDDIHRCIFYWLWVPIIQAGLDTYRNYWNNHKITKSSKKINPSGACPNNMFLNPTSVDLLGQQCHITVNPDTVARLRDAYGGQKARDKAYRFVSEEFQFNAELIHESLGSPELSLANGWKVFTLMVTKMEELRAAGTDIGL
ncbi:hypothetical protein C8R46DRAFT_1223186 [Mycena filopes]|nr:hypothetical protein C8R46DRAFT_1223186 [Mycena filopes]